MHIRATERALQQHGFATLGEAQERLSSRDFEALMQEIATIVAEQPSSMAPPRRKPAWWGRRRSRS